MAASILDSIKKVLNVDTADTAFDQDILMHVNSVFAVLTQMGIGPTTGYMIEDSTPTWDAFIGTDLQLNLVKSYMYLKVRLLFDPPQTSFHLDAMKKAAEEFEWRLNVKREGESWVDPNPPAPVLSLEYWWMQI